MAIANVFMLKARRPLRGLLSGISTCGLAFGLQALTPPAAFAQVFPVEQVESGFFISSTPTMTWLWPGTDAKATLVFMPGGNGVIGITPATYDLPYQFYQTLRRLSDPSRTQGKVDVIMVDSHKSLDQQPPTRFKPLRGTSDHMVRMLSVVEYYRAKLGRPVWLMGHSNGTVSVNEFYRYLRKKNRSDLLAGIIFSGSDNSAEPDSGVDIPVLYLHHANDGCLSTTASAARRSQDAVKRNGKARTEYIEISSGMAEARDPCYSGFHMYFGAGDEVAAALERFIFNAAAPSGPPQ